MNSILEKIAAHKKEEVKLSRQKKPVEILKKSKTAKPREFISALNARRPAIIAEIKKASPSKGIICSDFNVEAIVKTYAANGASCLSILTDIDFFHGHPDYIALAKAQCSLPVLRKDFIIDEYQVYESLSIGADCILLIVAMLDDAQLSDYCTLAQELGMAVLVESHTQNELERALSLPTPLMGINNRSLHSFKTDIHLSMELKKYVPEDKLIISESGINTREDIALLQSYGIHTFLIGESLMRASERGSLLQSLIQ